MVAGQGGVNRNLYLNAVIKEGSEHLPVAMCRFVNFPDDKGRKACPRYRD